MTLAITNRDTRYPGNNCFSCGFTYALERRQDPALHHRSIGRRQRPYNVFGWVIIYEALPQKLAALITSITSDPFLFLLIVNLILLFVGMLIDGIAAVILITPILLPIAMNDHAIDPYKFGVVICLKLVLGLLAPRSASGSTSPRR